MLAFWTAAALLVGVALAFLLVPLLRVRPPRGFSTREANLAVLRGQRSELDSDVARGVLPKEAHDEALAELLARAGEDLGGPAVENPVPASRRPWILVSSLAVLFPVAAIAIYFAVGMPEAVGPRSTAAAPPFNDRQIEAMVESLAKKVRERPQDRDGWMLLSRSLNALGRFPEAVEAYKHLATLAPNDPDVLADYADALAMTQGSQLAGKPAALVAQALAIDPNHPKSLALAGTAAMSAGEYRLATGYWTRLAERLPADSDDARQVRAILAEIAAKAASGKRPPPLASTAKPQAPAGPTQSPQASAGASVTGRVSIDPALKAKVAAGDTLFIFARAEGGGRMPLAVIRASASELPRAFRLDDSMSMAPNVTLSSAKQVRIEARVSKSGNAIGQPGDLVGTSAAVAPGAQGVTIVIDRVLP
jgi:cytochrome c-type biogenesis protein CcmH